MKVYQLRECEEYWMQDEIDLFTTSEKALASLENVRLIEQIEDFFLIVCSDDLIPMNWSGKQITKQMLLEASSQYNFYNIIHVRGNRLFGIFPREIK